MNEQMKLEIKENRNRPLASRRPQARTQTRTPVKPVEKVEISETEKGKFNDMLEDLIMMAVNDASSKISEISKEKMKNVTGGLNLPF